MVIVNLGGMLLTYVQDPDVVKDIYTGKSSKFIDKTDTIENLFKPLMPSFFLTMKGNKLWKD